MPQALSLLLDSASSQYASISDASQTGLDFTTTMTVEFRMKLTQLPSSKGSNMRVISKSATAADRGYQVILLSANDKIVFDYYADGTNVNRHSMDLAFDASDVGKWVHIAITVDASSETVTFYKNADVESGTYDIDNGGTSINTNSDAFEVGRFGGGSEYADMLIKDLRMWSDVRTSTEIANNYMLSTLDDTTGLVARWMFDGDYTDTSGNGNTLTPSNSPVFTADVPFFTDDFLSKAKITIDNTKVSGSSALTNFPVLFADGNFISDVYSKAKGFSDYSLDLESGSSQYASIAHGSQTGLNITSDITIEAKVKFESLGTVQTLVTKYESTGNQRGYWFAIYDDAGTPTFRWQISADGSTVDTYDFAHTPTINKWHHITLTWDASASLATLYIDGKKIGTVTGSETSIFSNTGTFAIGARSVSSSFTNFLDGRIKDVRVWNTVRTQKEIATYMNTELVGNEANLQGYWKFNNSALDETANNNDLTLNNAPSYVLDAPVGGADVRFTTDVDGENQIAAEFVNWDGGSEEAEVHVKIPSLSHNTDTEIYVWYENEGGNHAPADDAYGAQSVWSNGEQAVYHMQELDGKRFDSTSNANHLTDNNTVGSATGKIGRGGDFERSNSEYLSISDGDQTGLDITGDLSLEAIIKLESAPAVGEIYSIMGKWSGAGDNAYHLQYRNNGGTYEIRLFQSDGSSDVFTFTTTLTAGTYYYLVVVWDASASTAKLYLNATQTGGDQTGTNTSTQNSGQPFEIGTLTADYFFDGIIDEAVVRSQILGPDSISTRHANLDSPSTFATGSSLGGVSVSVSTQVITASLPQETLVIGNTQSPAVQTVTFSLPAESIIIVDTLIPSAQIATFFIPEYFVLAGDVVTTPDAQVATFSLPAEIILFGISVSPIAQVATFSLPAETITISETLTVSTQVGVFSFPTSSILFGIQVSPGAQVATFSLPAFTITPETAVYPSAQVATFSLPALTVGLGSILSPNAQVLTFTLPTLQKFGAVWIKTARATDATWSRSSFNDT